MTIEILNLQNRIRINKSNIEQAAIGFLKYLKQPKDIFINIIFVSPFKIRQINRAYFKKDKITDVIAIGPGRFKHRVFNNYLGDILICPQKAKTNSKRFNSTLKREILLYLAHGVLHLLGYNDLKIKDSLKMRKKEQKLIGLV